MIRKVSDIFIEKYDEIMDGTFPGNLLTYAEDEVTKCVNRASKISREKVFLDRKKTMIEIGVTENIRTTLFAFSNAVFDHVKCGQNREKLSPISKKVVDHIESEGFSMPETLYECLRGVLDYISGMTDRYATYVSRQVSGAIE